jgi:signal transduction histidine kinase
VVVAVAVAGVGTLGVNILLARLALEVTAARSAEFLALGAKGELGRQCAANPAGFLVVQSEGFELFALDAALRAPNPASPPVPPELLDQLRAGANYVSSIPRGISPSMTFVKAVRGASPCEYFAVRSTSSPRHLRMGLMRIAGVLAVATLVATLLGLFVVVRPLTRRIQVLKDAATRVGTEAYRPGARTNGDELDEVRHALDGAHASIAASAAELVRKNNALVAHLSDVAHDLRTPIAALQLKLERLSDPDLSPDERAEERTVALADALYLEGLCENLRFAATLREGLELERAECDLGRVVQRVHDRLSAMAKSRSVSFEVAFPDDELRAPVARVVAERVLSNLVTNALVHRDDEGGHVAVILEGGDGRFTLRVLDDGPGVAPEVIARLAEQRRPRWDEYGGTGLGLRIVSALCARSDITLAWGVPEGGGFEVTLQGALVARTTTML